MTRVDQSGAKAAVVDDVTPEPTNQNSLSPPVNMR